MKKWISAVLVLVLSLSCACSRESPAPAPTRFMLPPAQSEDSAPSPEAEFSLDLDKPERREHILPLDRSGSTFEIYTVLDPSIRGQLVGQNAVWLEIQERTGIGLEIKRFSENEAASQYGTVFAIRQYPDAMQDFDKFYTGGADGAIRDGVVADLAPLLNEYAPNLYWYLSRDEDSIRNAKTDGGAIAAIPRVLSEPCLDIEGPILRSDWLRVLGIASPQTFDEYYEVLRLFKKNWGGMLWFSGIWAEGFGVPCPLGDWSKELPLFVREGGEIAWGPTSREFGEYLTTISEWYAQELIHPASLKNPGELVPQNLVADGEVGIFTAECRYFDGYNRKAVLSGSRAPIRAVGDVHHYNGDYGKLMLPGSAFFITSACEDPGLLLSVMDYRYSREGAHLANHGVEGHAYTVKNGVAYYNKPVLDSVSNGIPSPQVVEEYLSGQGAFLENPGRYDVFLSQQSRALRDTWAYGRDNAAALPDFLTLTDIETARVNTIIGSIEASIKRETLRFIRGERPLDEFEEFKLEQSRLGVDVITEIYQAAYDRYLQR